MLSLSRIANGVHLAATALAISSCAHRSVAAPLGSGATDTGEDWPAYNRTLAGDRFSPLKEINAANVTQLKLLCTYTLPEVTALQAGPIVVRGTMYFTTDTISYAVDGATCAQKWRVVHHTDSPSQLSANRGFAYLNGELFRGTSAARVVALNAADGRISWDQELDVKGPGVTLPMAPIAANGLVYIGNAGGDLVGVSGHVYGLDARDGHVVWRFDVVPASGAAVATWTNRRLPRTGGAFWTSFTYDLPNGALYVPAGNPAPDFDAALRTGDNLYTNSVIALDGRTGRLLGYRQLVEHDSHDWDVDSPPALVTTRSGRRIVASANKDGQLAVLDRSAITPSLTRNADPAVLPVLYRVPTTTRLNVDVPLSRDSATRFCPGIVGGVEWNGAAYDPQSNALFVGAVDWCSHVQLRRDTLEVPPAGGLWFGAQNAAGDLFDPPDSARGWMTAFDAETGTVRWKYKASRPILAGLTPTAGGLVFVADLGGTLYAFDAYEGRVLWQTNTNQAIGGGVVSYAVGGRQRIGVASGMRSPIWPGGAQQSRILIYGLR
jgi:alcohol dehydrogenase (cytochrome c)